LLVDRERGRTMTKLLNLSDVVDTASTKEGT
jgi:hypothetical protein